MDPSLSAAITGSKPTPPTWGRLAAEMVAQVRPSPFPVFPAAVLREMERGDGHAVLALPGILRGDGQTAKLRAFLGGLGYAAYGWDLGVNLGPTVALIEGATARLVALSENHGAVSIVGHSMGGLFARLLAARYPSRIRQIITICSPVDQPARSVRLPLEPLLGFWPGVDLRALTEEISATPLVPSTCIYSRDDGIVSWACCRDARGNPADDIEVAGPHVTMVHNAEVLRVLTVRLARRIGS